MRAVLLAFFGILMSFHAEAQTASYIAGCPGCTVVEQAERPVLIGYGWADSGTFWNSAAQFYRSVDGRCHFSGLVYRWSSQDHILAAYLTQDCIPDKDYWFPLVTNGGVFGTAQVRSGPGNCAYGYCGEIDIFMAPDSAWASLDGISYRAKGLDGR